MTERIIWKDGYFPSFSRAEKYIFIVILSFLFFFFSFLRRLNVVLRIFFCQDPSAVCVCMCVIGNDKSDGEQREHCVGTKQAIGCKC